MGVSFENISEWRCRIPKFGRRMNKSLGLSKFELVGSLICHISKRAPTSNIGNTNVHHSPTTLINEIVNIFTFNTYQTEGSSFSA